ncbi:MAG: amino acid kinase family protein [Gammaproteobacteria bacterium]
MWIVKLGGSLLDSAELGKWLDFLAKNGGGKCVIVPGGGKFADLVRLEQKRLGFGDDIAHDMAIQAMRQTALLFHGLNRNLPIAETAEAIAAGLSKNRTVVWSPDPEALGRETIPKSWDVTSDSLAAWLAARLDAAKLILVKSAQIPDGKNLSWLVDRDIIDSAFSGFLEGARFEVIICQRNDLELFGTLLTKSYF